MVSFDSRCKGKFRIRLLSILAISFLIHLTFALVASKGLVQDDAPSYRDLGRNLAHGQGFVFSPGAEPTAWRAPAYPVFLGAIFKMTGDSETVARAANALLWVGTTACVAVIAFQLLEPSAALLACALVAFFPEFIGLSGLLYSESLSIFLFVASLAALVALAVKRRWSLAILTGVLLGCCILSRSTFVVLPCLIVLAGFAGLLKRSQAIVVALLAFALMGCWTARNYRLLHLFIPVESNSTMNLFMGSRPYAPMPFTIRVVKMIAADPEWRSIVTLSPAEQYTAFGKAATRDIRRAPGRFALLAISKTIDFWSPDYFVARNFASGSFGEGVKKIWKPVLFVTVTSFLVIWSAALVTIVRERRSRVVQFAVLLLIAYTLPHAIVYGASKYHLPLTPIGCLLAAPALLTWVRGKRGHEVKGA